MIPFDKLLTCIEVPKIISSLFESWQAGQNVSCPFAGTKHINGTDSSKSMSISNDGKVFCHACGYKATTIVNLYNDIFGYDFTEGCIAFYSEFVEPTVPEDYVDGAHKALLKNELMQAYLKEKRDITISTIKNFKLGWNSNRLTIPIYNDFNMCVNVRRYDLMKRTDIKILSYAKGFGAARLFPLQALEKKKVYLFEGEMDTLLAIQTGLNGITLTTGALVWNETLAKQFLDKDVIIVPDIDKTGLEGLEKRAGFLNKYAHSISIIMLPPMGEKKKDFTDFYQSIGKKDISKFLALKSTPYKGKDKQKTILIKPYNDIEILSFIPTPTESVNLDRAKILFDYLKGTGAFFKNVLGVLFYAQREGNIFRVSTGDSQFLGFLGTLSGLLNTATASGKFILQHLINNAQSLCTFSKSAFWSLLQGQDLFLYGANGSLLHFKNGTYTKVPNAVNTYNVLLELPSHAQPLRGGVDVPSKGVQMLWENVMSNIAVSDENRYLLMCWTLGIIFRVEVRNKPLMRLSASTAYGKSTASKLLSILLYGDEMLHHSASTIASMYSLASEYPLLIFDNLETRNMVPALEDFLIVAATGGMKSKRVMDTTSAVAFERVDSLVLTNGIESFSKHEVLNRTIELALNIDRFGKNHFHELKVIEELKQHRDTIMLSLIGLMSKRVIPRFMNNEVQRIAKHFETHSKERFNEYFGVMAIILDAIWPYIPLKGYALPHDLVNYWIMSQNTMARASDESTNDVLHYLDTFVMRRNNLLDAIVPVIHKNGITTIKCHTSDLLSDFRLLAKHLNMRCPWYNERQLGTRLADASDILHKAGWARVHKVSNGRRMYEFTKKDNKTN